MSIEPDSQPKPSEYLYYCRGMDSRLLLHISCQAMRMSLG